MAEGEELRLLKELVTPTTTIRVTVDKELLHAFLSLKCDALPADVSAARVIDFLRGLSLVVPPTREAQLHPAIEQVLAGTRPMEKHCCAEGTAPTGRKGVFQWLVALPSIDREASQLDPRLLGEPLLSVNKGDSIAHVVLSTPGQPGMNVLGEAIQPDVTPIPFRPGKNIGVRGDEWIALCDGQVVAKPGVVSVEPVLRVLGDVDFAVGNIDFHGSVEIAGDVLDDFHVRASHDIKVAGMVGAAEVTTPGNLVVLGGVAGHGRAKLVCGQSARVKYVHNAIIETGAKLVVETDAINSRLRAGGDIAIRGRLLGGEIEAGAFIEVGTIGSVLGIRTILTLSEEAIHHPARGVHEERSVAVVNNVVHGITVIRIGSHVREWNEDTPGPLRLSVDEDGAFVVAS